MTQFIEENYLAIKALHIIFVIFWMAGLLYLPRLFVYHARVKAGSVMDKTFQVMEKKLLRIIINPTMIISIILGSLLIYILGFGYPAGWLHGKLFCVFLLLGFHGMCVKYMKDFTRGKNKKSELYFRWFNEVPGVLIVIIVFLVILKPF